MTKFKLYLKIIALIVSATVGAGMFALPFSLKESGWLIGLLYLIVLSGIIIFAHSLYWRVLEKSGKGNQLLGLSKIHLGSWLHDAAFLAIIGGLLLSLVVYLILGARFFALIFPGLDPTYGILIFWLISSLPLLFGLNRLMTLELLGAIFLVAIIVFIFAGSDEPLKIFSIPTSNWGNAFLPFGAILFSLAGWTAVDPALEFKKNNSGVNLRPMLILTGGTIASAILYVLFVSGIFGSATIITQDAVSGLLGWQFWKIAMLAVLGLFAIWTSYLPISLEIKNSFIGLGWGRGVSIALVLFAPLVLIAVGLRSFLAAVDLAGGLFLSMQYLFIFLVARKALALIGIKKVLAELAVLIFVLAAIYQIYYFVQ